MEDRLEAMRQLYPDSMIPDSMPVPKARKGGMGDFTGRQRAQSGGRTHQGSGGSGYNGGYAASYGNGGGPRPPTSPLQAAGAADGTRRADDGPPKAPSMTPELLFGSKLELSDKKISPSNSKSEEEASDEPTATVTELQPPPSTPSSSSTGSATTTVSLSSSSRKASAEKQKEEGRDTGLHDEGSSGEAGTGEEERKADVEHVAMADEKKVSEAVFEILKIVRTFERYIFENSSR